VRARGGRPLRMWHTMQDAACSLLTATMHDIQQGRVANISQLGGASRLHAAAPRGPTRKAVRSNRDSWRAER
jgi:hypothetical protein